MHTPPWTAVGWTMLHFLWAGGLFTAAAWLVRRAMRSAHPDVQYAYSLACFGVLAFMPGVIAYVVSSPGVEAPADRPVIDLEGFSTLPSPPERFEPTAPAPIPSPQPVPFQLSGLVDWLPWIWLAGAPLTFARLALGLAGAERLRRRSRPLADDALTAKATALARSLGLARSVAVAVCDRIAGPMLVGVARPLILLPTAALTGWPPEAIEMALLHELAHVRRWDNLVNLFQRLVESVLFFHPAVWVVSSWARLDREHACDRLVVSQTGRPVDYARTLFALCDTPAVPRSLGLSMSEGPLLTRIRRILNVKDDPMKPTRLTLALSLAPLLLPVALLAAHRVQAPKPASAPDDARAETRKVVAEAIELMKKKGGSSLFSYSLNSTAETLDNLGAREGALATLREAAKEAAAAQQWVNRTENRISSGPSAAYQLLIVGKTQASLGDKDGALATLRLAVRLPNAGEEPTHRLWIFTEIAREFAAMGSIDDAREVGRKANAFYRELPPPIQYQAVLPFLAAIPIITGDVEAAFALLDRPKVAGENIVIRQATDAEMLARMADYLPTTDIAAANSILARIARRFDDLKPKFGGSEMMAAIAEARARLGDFDAAMVAARKVADAKVTADGLLPSNSLGTMLQIAMIQRKSGDRQGAKQTLRQALDFSRTLKKDQARSSRLMSFAEMMISLDDIEGALRCVEDIDNPGDRFEVLKQIAFAQRSRGDEAAARATAERAMIFPDSIKKNPPKPVVELSKGSNTFAAHPAYPLSAALRMTAEIQAVLGDFAIARDTILKITEQDERAMAYAQIARLQAASGDAKGALAWARELKEQPQMILKALIEGAAQARPPAPAVKSSGLMPVPAEGVAMDEGGGRAFSFFIGAYW